MLDKCGQISKARCAGGGITSVHRKTKNNMTQPGKLKRYVL